MSSDKYYDPRAYQSGSAAQANGQYSPAQAPPPYSQHILQQQQNQLPQQGQYPPQYQQEKGHPQQQGYPQQQAHSQQQSYPPQQGYLQQQSYCQQQGYPHQQGYPQQQTYAPQQLQYYPPPPNQAYNFPQPASAPITNDLQSSRHGKRGSSGHKGRDTSLGIVGGALIADLIFPGLGTIAAGAIGGGYLGNRHAKKKEQNRELDERLKQSEGRKR